MNEFENFLELLKNHVGDESHWEDELTGGHVDNGGHGVENRALVEVDLI